jgi:hypothetical protein
MNQCEPALVTPFWVRIATETKLSPGWLLIAFPVVLYPIYLALEVLFGRGLAAAMDFSGDWKAIIPLRATAFWGYLVMMLTYAARGTFRDLDALRPVLRGGDAVYAELRQQLTRFERRRLWVGALAGGLVACVIQEIVIARWAHLAAGSWSLRDFCMVVMAFALWITAGRGAVHLLDSARLYSRIGERHVVVDLLDLGSLSPLARHGLRIVLLVTIFTGVAIISVIVRSASLPGPSAAALILAPIWSLPLATAIFVLPVRGLRRQIRARKAEELGRIREDIRRSRELAAEAGTKAAEAGAKLPGLLAYKHEIESVREWPFDAPTLTRFFLYIAIPLGSWVGGALVERLLGAALD